MIEIMETRIVNDNRAVDIIISNSLGQSYFFQIGRLPLEGDLQIILDAREAELWAAAQIDARLVDLYQLAAKRVLKAFALVVMDEINILRNRAGLAPRIASQIDEAIKAKLKQ